MQSKKKRNHKTMEQVRNILLVLLAAFVIFIFFNLDIVRKGESVFSNTSSKKLKFAGSMDRKDYTDTELERIRDYIKVRNKLFEEVKIEASPQDKYKEIAPTTEILFEVHVVMADGFKFTTPVRRTQRKDLSLTILAKLDKDVQAYIELKKQGKKPTSMINTM
ncbi:MULTISPECIES: hypothetical protein [unclassified Pseudodesulfovibrio]|uniref:hypothetical protein n=1 Tax=unclassified Pseudodesulfovibrio TaxID=2661612 RepID=UPI000FEB8519|nr:MULTISPECIES: hypothetical protein [unclassified Pseudodesulfovibrio]MCJ2165634.1 hypothetical protein [Pseudodesulfovibrio sp. S3-i]RWU03041.1 hypothetical protein DWB63_13415 [Pseudodesulfovibrio sp. S3]